MSFLIRRGEGPSFPYAGQPMFILAGNDGQPTGFAAISVPSSGRAGSDRGSGPYGTEALVLGIWAPAEPAVAIMRDIGAALVPGVPPDPGEMRELYARHASHLMP